MPFLEGYGYDASIREDYVAAEHARYLNPKEVFTGKELPWGGAVAALEYAARVVGG